MAAVMSVPWIEIEEHRDGDAPTRRIYPQAAWRAQFACHVGIPPYHEWVRRKWGLNASWLFDEALDRQRIFLESQYGYPDEFGMEPRDYRTLAFRFIQRSGEGLLVVVLGKIHAPTADEARDRALSYYKEIKATIPYDYHLVPALTQEEFDLFSGKEIIDDPLSFFAEIKRLEFPLPPKNNSFHAQGFWKSSPHAHEQIWRSLAASPSPLLLNVSLRSTILYDSERDAYLQKPDDTSDLQTQPLDQITVAALNQWNKEAVDRRLSPWKKFFYLQLHLASTHKLSPDLFRTIGTSLAINKEGLLPGYQVVLPRQDEKASWRRNIKHLDFILSESYLSCPRLSAVADLEEVVEVMRLPYCPPEEGFPDFHFANKREHPWRDENKT
jgi:hypothetical protein